MEKKTIGFIGLGNMGGRMARNLQKGGYSLVIYNRTKEKGKELLENGAVWGDTPAETAHKADILFTMLSTPEAVEEIAMSDNGILSSLRKNTIWVDCSTVNPSFSKKMAEEAARLGISFLDAPVSGTTIPAEKGELIFLIGGKKEVVEEVMPLLKYMGKTFNHVGENGKGSSMKMVINLLLGQAMAAFSEALTLGEQMGISQDVLFQTLIGGPVTAPFLAGKKQKLSERQFDADFALQWMQKDLHLVNETAYELGLSLPLSGAAEHLYGLAKQFGFGESDFSAIYQLLQGKKEI